MLCKNGDNLLLRSLNFCIKIPKSVEVFTFTVRKAARGNPELMLELEKDKHS